MLDSLDAFKISGPSQRAVSRLLDVYKEGNFSFYIAKSALMQFDPWKPLAQMCDFLRHGLNRVQFADDIGNDDPICAPISIKPFPGKHSLVAKYVASWSLATVPTLSGERYATRINSTALRAVNASRPILVSTNLVFIDDKLIPRSQDSKLLTMPCPFDRLKRNAPHQ
jgi:hypothetical protein